MSARDLILYVGDVLHDETLQDIGVLLERYITVDEVNGVEHYGVAVWKTWWVRAGEEQHS